MESPLGIEPSSFLTRTRTAIRTFTGFCRVCGFRVAVRWLTSLLRHLRIYIKTRNLQQVNDSLGTGPFLCRSSRGRAWLAGEQVISAIHEVWICNVYLTGGFLSISPNAVVVDLGASMGNFTMLALTYGEGVTVVCVEQSKSQCMMIEHLLELNEWSDRARICRHFIGGTTEAQLMIAADPNNDATLIQEHEFIRRFNLTHIDFLKCDIEGSEFDLLTEKSQLLRMSDQVAVELHHWGGNMTAFKAMLARLDFEVVTQHESPTECLVHARRRAITMAGR